MAGRKQGPISKLREAAINTLAEKGYQLTGFRTAVRKHLLEWAKMEWEDAKEDWEASTKEPEEEWEDLAPGDRLDMSEYEPPVWPKPTAWKEYRENDSMGKEWIIFECAEPLYSLSADKATRYGELWLHFDDLDQRILLRVRAIDEHGHLHSLDTTKMYYQDKDEATINRMTTLLGHVTDDQFPNRPPDDPWFQK